MLRRKFLISGGAGLLALAATPSGLAFTRDRTTDRGIRDALRVAAELATQRLGQRGGFFDDDQVHIPLPRSVSRVQSQLRRVGLAGSLDDLERDINHAAEDTMPGARRIFLNTIQDFSVRDGVGILRGGNTAATDYLRGRTEGELTSLLRRPMGQALASSGVYDTVQSIEPHLNSGRNLLSRWGLGSNSPSESLRETVTDHATEKAIDGVFYYIAREEIAIRRDPVRRTTDILRRVFG